MTPEGRDEVSEQRHEDEAVLSGQLFTWLLPTPAQVQSQGLREGGGGADATLGLLLKHRTNKQRLVQRHVSLKDFSAAVSEAAADVQSNVLLSKIFMRRFQDRLPGLV